MKYKKFILKDFPNDNFPNDTTCFDFLENAEIDEQVKEGEALIKVIWISLDPILRTWISGAKSYLDPVKPGSPIPGFGVGKVVKINKKKGTKNTLQINNWCVGIFQWSQYIKRDITSLHNLPLNNGENMYKFLTVYGPTGFTSYLSIKREIIPFKIENPINKKLKTPQDMNIVISSAAGGVGLTVTEYLSKLGYKRVFGIAGSDEKCKVAVQLGCKGCINYKRFHDKDTIRAKEFQASMSQMLNGQKIDIYYENVGQDMLSSMLNLMANHSKVIMCGATATYNNWGKQKGIQNYENIIAKRIQVKGILYFNQGHNQRVSSLMQMISHDVKGYDYVVKGIEKLPTTYRDMIHGKFIGKPVVQLWNQGEISFS